jgi:vesicle-associated membrane protein 7
MKIVRERLAWHNDLSHDKVTALHADITDVRDIMMTNIDIVLQRGEQLDHLTDLSANVAQRASTFERGALSVKRTMFRRKCMLTIIIVVIVLIILVVLLLIGCKVDFSRCNPASYN